MKLKRVKGFTIAEAIITMILTSLLLLLGMSVFQYYSRLLNSIIRTGDTMTTISQFQAVIREDFTNADLITFDGKLVCANGDKKILYLFDQEYVIRESAVSVDTFSIENTNPIAIPLRGKPELIEHFSVSCKNRDMIFVVSISKVYPLGIKFKND